MEQSSNQEISPYSNMETSWSDWIIGNEYSDGSVYPEELSTLEDLVLPTGEISSMERTSKSEFTSKLSEGLALPYSVNATPLNDENFKLDSEIFGDYVSSVLQFPEDDTNIGLPHPNIGNHAVKDVLLNQQSNHVNIPELVTSFVDEESRTSVISDVAPTREADDNGSNASDVGPIQTADDIPNADAETSVQNICEIRTTQEADDHVPSAVVEIFVSTAGVVEDDAVTEKEKITNTLESWESGENYQENEPSFVQCSKHPQTVAQKYCNHCDQLVCGQCLCVNHIDHDVEEVDEAMEMKKRELVEMLDILAENYVPKLQQRIVSNKHFSQKYDKKIDDLLNEVKNRGERLQTLLHDARDEAVTTLTDLKNAQKKKSREMESEWDERLIHIRDLVKEGNSGCSSGKAFRIVKDLNDTLKSLDEALSEFQKIPKPPTLRASDIIETSISDLIGHLKATKVKDTTLPKGNNLEVLTTFKFAKKSIWSLETQGNGSAWIAVHENSTVRLVTDTGIVLRSVTLSAKIYDITVRSDGNLLISAVHGSHIWQLTSDREITSFIKFKDMFPCGLFASTKGHVLVGLVGGNLDDEDTHNRQFVVKITNLGSVLDRFEKDKDGKPLYTLPYRISENTNGDICVVDWVDPAEGRLVVTDSVGTLKFIYTGFVDDAQAFRPGGIICSSTGNILICDIYRDNIHVLNKDGQCTMLLNSRRLGGLYGPCDLSLEQNGRLWIGGCKGNIQCLKYTE